MEKNVNYSRSGLNLGAGAERARMYQYMPRNRVKKLLNIQTARIVLRAAADRATAHQDVCAHTEKDPPVVHRSLSAYDCRRGGGYNEYIPNVALCQSHRATLANQCAYCHPFMPARTHQAHTSQRAHAAHTTLLPIIIYIIYIYTTCTRQPSPLCVPVILPYIPWLTPTTHQPAPTTHQVTPAHTLFMPSFISLYIYRAHTRTPHTPTPTHALTSHTYTLHAHRSTRLAPRAPRPCTMHTSTRIDSMRERERYSPSTPTTRRFWDLFVKFFTVEVENG